MEWNERDFRVEKATKELKCHKCEQEIPKDAVKVKADLGRVSRSGHCWWYQLCVPCARKKLHEIMSECSEKIEQLDMEEYKMKRTEERKWL